LGKNLNVKICDFGSASRVSDGKRLFEIEEIVGSEEYNAPEITMGKVG
jgi:serine/threonine protein kinase